MRLLSVLVFAALVGCMPPKDKARLAALDLEVQALSQRVAVLEAQADPKRDPAVPTEAQEMAATELLKEASERYGAGDVPNTIAALEALHSSYSHTRAAASAERLEAEVAVIGVEVSPLQAERWFAGETDITDGVVLVVAFEVWCPHCLREMPRLNEHYAQFQAAGVREVVGLTRVTRSASDAQVAEYVAAKNFSFPIAKEGGKTADELSIRGVPAAALLRDGTVIWRGHPARLSEAMLRTLIAG